MTQPTLTQRLQGLAASLAILLLVVGLPLVLVAIGAAPWTADLSHFGSLLTSPDDGTLAMDVIAWLAWLTWLVLLTVLLVEAAARVRGLPAPSLPGLSAPQRAVGQLLTVAALLFVATPSVFAAFPVPPAHAATAAPVDQVPILDVVREAPLAPPAGSASTDSASPSKHVATVDYTVKRGDSLWKIADRVLGDGARFPEIVDLNQTVLHGRPDFIAAGTVLKVPEQVDHSEHAASEYVVRPGDTLSEIADEELGDSSLYPELFAASRDTVQPDGTTLTDPNLIRPGWEITIPGPAKHKAQVPQNRHEAGAAPNRTDPPKQGPAGPPSGTRPTDPAPDTTDARPVSSSPSTVDSENESSAPGWLMPGLAGAGAVLAALVLLAVRAHRNTQLRYRRPGQTIAPPPEELRAVEKTAFASGAPLTRTIENLDRALLHLAGACADSGRGLPRVVTATLAKDTVTLHLAEDATLPEQWTGAGSEWSLTLNQALAERGDVLPPYPMLVSVGQDDDALHLANLEHLAVVALTGDTERAKALARHIAAELALNPWSTLVEVTVIGLGEELAPLDTLRLRHHATGEQVLATIVRDVTTSLENGWGDPDPYRVVITTGDGTGDLAPLLAAPSSRVGAALVSLAVPVPESTVFELDRAGRLSAPGLGLDLQAAGLTSEEAKACAAIVDLTRESEPVRVPPFEQAADGWRSYADQAGALREELTDVRAPGPAGDRSLLPRTTAEYIRTAATTNEDIETLAPIVPEKVRRAVEEADPTLDEDIAAWFNPGCRRPRLTLLGPVSAKAFGEIKPVIMKRRPYFAEILAYLALHPKGATASQLADAFGIAASRARTDISSLRDWLGTNPTTGPYLPAANESPAYFESGVKTYQVQGVLVDLDLFRRLRARGEARGTEGIKDLKTAMSLIGGAPFSLLREKGWSWLLDTERVHETIECAIVDTAHVLIVDALAKGDLSLARDIAETACDAAPYDDICRLDLAKVACAEGHEDTAEMMLKDDVFDRTDDYLPPIDLPQRSREIVAKEAWNTTKRRPSA